MSYNITYKVTIIWWPKRRIDEDRENLKLAREIKTKYVEENQDNGYIVIVIVKFTVYCMFYEDQFIYTETSILSPNLQTRKHDTCVIGIF